MASPGEVDQFLSEMIRVFSPSMVKIAWTETDYKTGEKRKELVSVKTNEPLGKGSLLKQIRKRSSKTQAINIDAIYITTVAGTIRVYDPSYKRKPKSRMRIMDLDIDILTCNPDAKESDLQQVCITKGRLRRNGNATPKLHIHKISEKNNEDSTSPRIKMPSPMASFLRKKPKKYSL